MSSSFYFVEMLVLVANFLKGSVSIADILNDTNINNNTSNSNKSFISDDFLGFSWAEVSILILLFLVCFLVISLVMSCIYRKCEENFEQDTSSDSKRNEKFN
ncbi:putative SP-containing membrane protein [Vairimorpha necatrix]|uniref:SP-containing membrane protein n=1 Tax=Vairimorpha necatrix TaxID=6039 RepID=A0AAX4J933_9MICR